MNELLSSIKKASADYRISSLDRQIQVVDHLLSNNKVIDIAVLGQFKAGKSSFLNGFIEKDLLPTGVVPLTSVITRITYGEKERALVTFADGRIDETSITCIDEYVSESKNQENRKNVLWVDLELPELKPYRGLRFVDTPGLGSIFKHNSEVTERWVPEIGIAMIAVSADRPLSEGEILLIKEAEKYSPDIVLLLTKVDLFTESQISEIIEFMESSLRKAFDRDIPIYCFSSKKNSRDYRNRLVSDLFMPLMNDFSGVFDKILKYKVITLAHACLSYLQLNYEVSKRTDAERAELKSLIMNERLQVDFIRNDLVKLVTESLSQNWDLIYDHFKPHRVELNSMIVDEFSRDYPSWRGNLYAISRKYESWLREVLKREMKIIIDSERTFIINLLENAQNHFSYLARSFRDHLNNSVRSALGIEMKSEEWVVELKEIRTPDIKVNRASDFHLDMLWFLFPMFIFKGLFKRYFISQIPYEVSNNFRRCVSELTGLVNSAINDLREQTQRYILNELSSIDYVFSGKKSSTDDLMRAIDTIKQFLPLE